MSNLVELKPTARVIDVCCGSKMFYFDKETQDCIFTDLRKESHVLCDGRTLNINPDVQMDFTDMKFPNGRFKLVVFDPPHMDSLGEKSWMALKYGVLKDGWKDTIRKGFEECFRVLEPDGVLIFKWSDVDIKVSDVIKLSPIKPLFGHRTMINNRTIWMCFMNRRTP
jgi:ubiquinone/menaquinone biosynthesis C-methylase UbiE